MSAVSTALALLLPSTTLSGPALQTDHPQAEETGPQFELRGLAFVDSAWFDGAVARKRDDHESELRLAELVAVAEFDPFTAIAGYDFSRDGAWRDLGVVWTGDKRWISVGQFKEPASLDKLTVEGDGPLIETSSLTSAFGLNRRLGVQAGAYGYRWSVTGAAFSGSLDRTDAQGAGPGQSGVAARVTANWQTDTGRVHLGAYGRTLDYDGAGVLAASSPNTKLGAKTFYLDLTGANGADSSVLAGLEAAWSRPGLHVSAELARMSFDLPAGDDAATGAYLQASWAITGERRDYNAKKGGFSGLTPANPLSEGGIGAVEITARVDGLDFEAFNRGRATAYTIAAAWTPVENVRVSANFTAERGSASADGRDSDVLMVRVQAGF